MLNRINAMVSLPVIAMMVALFSAALLRNSSTHPRRTRRQVLLLLIIILDLFALICNFFLYFLLDTGENIVLIKLFWVANYVTTYALVLAFHYFLLAHLTRSGPIPKLLYYIPLPLVLIVTVIYLATFESGMYFTISASGELLHGPLYGIYLVLRLTLLLLDVVITNTYSAKLGVRYTVLFLVYEIVPIIFFLIDSSTGSGTVFLVISLLILIDYISVNVDQDVELARQKQYAAEQERRLTVEQTKIMISQIQPHFLYNVLSSVMACCLDDPKKAVAALSDFSDYLRANMRSLTTDAPVPFSKELEHIQTYIRLEKFRFEDRIRMEYDLEVEEFFLPTLTLQPLVENAVKHGVGQRPEGGTVTLKTRRNDAGILITVTDNGVGFDVHAPAQSTPGESSHVGIANVRSRLSQVCGGSLTIESSPGVGTTVTVLLPQNTDTE